MTAPAPLEGIRIVEMGAVITAPLAAMLLADLGADAIKVEKPGEGDPFRGFRGAAHGGPRGDSDSPNFTAYNRNKRSLALDLRKTEGRAVFLKLIATADALIENFRPGVLARLGLAPEALAAANPRLVHATITGFGADGPYAARPSYDAVAAALSGMTSVFADDAFHDLRGPTITDNVSGMYAAYGVLAALLRRGRTGRGGRIEVNMLEAGIAFMPDLFANQQQLGIAQTPYTRAASSQSFVLRCADGKLIALHLSSQPKFWEALVAALERPDLAEDKRFATRPNRMANYRVLKTVLDEAFARRTLPAWLARLASTDVPHAPVLAIEDVPADPQVKHLGTFAELVDPVKGAQSAINNPVTMDRARMTLRNAAPALGDATDALLAELGYDAESRAALRAGGIVG